MDLGVEVSIDRENMGNIENTSKVYAYNDS